MDKAELKRLMVIEMAAKKLASYPPNERSHHRKAYVLWDDLELLRAALSTDGGEG